MEEKETLFDILLAYEVANIPFPNWLIRHNWVQEKISEMISKRTARKYKKLLEFKQFTKTT